MASRPSSTRASHRLSTPVPVPDDVWEDLHEIFPSLERANCWITSEIYSEEFTCVNWSTDRWETTHEVDAVSKTRALLKELGCKETGARGADANVDLMGTAENGYGTHVTCKYDGPRPDGMPAGLWETFMFPSTCFTHGRFEVEQPDGSTKRGYGKVVASFIR